MKYSVIQRALSVLILVIATKSSFGQTYETLPYYQDFETSTSFASYPELISTGTNLYRNQILTDYLPSSGRNSVLMDVSTDDNMSTNELWVHLDLSGETQVELSFYLADIGDEDHTEDGIYLSDDGGATFTALPVYTFLPTTYSDWLFQKFVLDIDALASGAGLSLTNNFVIKFSHRDNFNPDDDGFIIDDIAVYNSTLNTSAITTSPSCVGGNDGTATMSTIGGDGSYYAWPDAAAAAITPVTKVAQSTNTNAISSTGNNRMLVVAVVARTIYADVVEVEYGGQRLNWLATQSTIGGNRNMILQYYYLDEAGIAAAAGNTVTVTQPWWWDYYRHHSAIFDNVDQDNPFGVITSAMESNTNDDDLSMAAMNQKIHEYCLIAVGNAEKRNTSGNTTYLTGYSELTDETYDPVGGNGDDDLGLSLQGLAITGTQTQASALIDLSGNVESKAAMAIIIHPDGSYNSGLSAGVYSVTASDVESNSTTYDVSITDPAPMGITLTPNDYNGNEVSCFGGSDGIVLASASGGTAPSGYAYTWSSSANSQITATATGLDAGIHSVTIEDDNNCAVSGSITLSEPTALNTAPAATLNASCNGYADGALVANASNGTPPYTYQWNAAALGSTNATVLGLGAGNGYAVTVTDNNGCKSSGTATITEPTAISVTSTLNTTISCNNGNDGQITFSASGGGNPTFNYSWTTNAGVQSLTSGIGTALSSGVFTVTVTDGDGCEQVSSNVTLTNPSGMALSLNSVTNVLCNGDGTGAIDINVSGGAGGYTYNWTGGATSQDITTQTAGVYTVTVTDANTCTSTLTATITEPTLLSSSVDSNTPETCFGYSDGSFDISVSGGVSPYTYVWDDPSNATTQDVSGLTGGTFNATITDANLCSITEAVVVNGSAALLSASAVATSVTCNGASTGSVDLTVSNGTAAYTYIWDDSSNSTSEDIVSQPAGVYSVTITDLYGCVTTTSSTITEDPGITISSNHTDISNCSSSDGLVNITVTGGYSTNYTFVWNSGQTTEDITAIIGGIYTVTVNDGTCNKIASEFVNVVGGTHSVTLTPTNTSCVGGTDGAISITLGATTNTASVYVWSNAETTANVTGLSAGTYSVTVSDGSCVAFESTTVSNPPSITISNAINQPTCFGASNATINITVTGGTIGTGYSYNWSGTNAVVASEDQSGLSDGTYDLTVTDGNGCTGTIVYTITEPATLGITTTATTTITCNAASTGQVTTTIGGGSTPYSYSWSTNAGSQSATSGIATGLGAGTYDVTVTDLNGCSVTDSQVLTEPTALSLTPSITNAITCNAGANGEITAVASGGSPGYTYSWSVNAGSQSSTTGIGTALSDGTYTISATDIKGCLITVSQVISQPTVISSNLTLTNPTCPGNADGQIASAASGGTVGTGYSYVWSTAATTSTITGLNAGPIYKLTITDGNGCKRTVNSIVLTNPSVLNLSTSVTSDYNGNDISCIGSQDGQGTASLSGGTVGTGYSYIWNTAPTQNTAIATGLGVGTHNVTATDGNGCQAFGSVNVGNASILSVQIFQDTTFFGEDLTCFGSADAEMSATITNPGNAGGTGYSYDWSSGETTPAITSKPAGLYTVSLTDGNGCIATDDFTINSPTALTISASVVSSYGADNYDISCLASSDGSASALASGGTVTTGYAYNWSNGENTQQTTSALASGTHSVTITDANGCNASTNVIITPPSAINPNQTQVNVAVAGSSTGQASVAPSGGQSGYTYLWTQVGGVITPANQNNSAITNMPAGSYSMTITDANGCTLPVTFTITENSVLSGGQITHVDANGGAILKVCENDTIISNVNNLVLPTGGAGGYTYTWQYSTDFLTWSALPGGITTSSFPANISVSETKVIRRVVTDAVSAVAYSNSMILLSVDTTTTLSFIPSSFCDNDGVTENLLVSPSNGTSIWVFNDLVSPANVTLTTNGDGTGQFTPNNYPAGNHEVTHIYTNGDGCVSTLVTSVTINSPTAVSFAGGTPTIFSIGVTPAVVLDGYVTPFSSDVDTSFFDTNVHGVSYSGSQWEYQPTAAGTHAIEYVYINSFGCSDTATHNITAQNNVAVLELNGGTSGTIGTHLCMTNSSFDFEGFPNGSNTDYLGPRNTIEVTYGLSNTLLATSTNNTLSIPRSSMIVGGETYTVKFLFRKADTSLDSIQSTFDIVDNYNVDFFEGTTQESSDYEFCLGTSSKDYRARYTYGTQNLVGLGTYTSSIGGATSTNLGSSASDFGQVTYAPNVTVTNEIITYNHTIQPSGCLIDTSHNVVVYDLPSLSLDIASDTPHYCVYDFDTITPTPFGPTGNFLWGSGLGSTAITNTPGTLPGDTTICIADEPGSTPDCNYTNDLCTDGYNFGIATYTSSLFDIPTTSYSSATFKIYYADCTGGNAEFTVSLNGTPVYTFSAVGSCSCIPSVYPQTITFDGTLMDGLWLPGTNNYFEISNDDPNDIAFAGATVSLINAGNLGAFDASQSLEGLNSIVYEYTDGNGCFNDTTYYIFTDYTISVDYSIPPLLNIANGDTTLIASFDSAGIATSYFSSTAGITNSGFGVVDTSILGTFDPTIAGLDTFDIAYNYTDTNGCSFVLTETTIVQEASGYFNTIDSNYCESSTSQVINAFVTNSNGADGLFHGRGVSDPAFTPLAGQFSAIAAVSALGTGPDTIYYTYLGFDGLTEFTIDTIINVSPLPILTFGADPLLNVTQGPYDLTSVASPYSSAASSFSGAIGITNDSLFYPNLAGIGSHTITYTYTDALGCTNTIDSTIIVDTASGSFFNIPGFYCIDGSVDSIWAVPTNSDGNFGVFSGSGITDLGNDTAQFDPTFVSEGDHIISFTYMGFDGTTPFTITDTLTIDSVGNATISNASFNFGYCFDAPIDTLYGSPNSGGTNVFSTFSGLTTNNDTAFFNPSIAGVGTHSILYTYTDGTSGCQIITTQQVEVYPLPVMSFDMDTLFNVTESGYTLTAVPDPAITPSGADGSTFILNASILTGGIFNANSFGVGNDTIFYAYQDSLGCNDTIYDTFVVQEAAGTFFGIPSNNHYCEDAATDSIWAVPANGDGNIGVYTSSSAGVVDLGNDTASFDAPTHGTTGTVTLTYSYYGFDNTTLFEIDTTFVVAPLPTLVFDMDTLFNVIEGPYNLYSIVANSTDPGAFFDDFFSGTGVNGDNFEPATAGIGNFGITYTYTDTIGCVNTIIDSTVVEGAQGLFYGIPSNNHYCIDDPKDTIWAITPNSNGNFGTYTASTSGLNDLAIDTATFIAAGAGVGPVTVTYSYYGFDNTTLFQIDTTFYVAPLPVLSFDMDTLFNVIEPPYALSANSTIPGNVDTSYFSGTGINGTDFEPNTAGVGDYTITFTYVDTIGCINTITDHTIVQEASGTFQGIRSSNYYCYDGAEDIIWAEATNKDPNQVGWYDGTPLALVDINGQFIVDSAYYRPYELTINSVNTIVNDTITYYYYGFDGTTLFSFDTIVYVINLGNANISGFEPTYCIDDEIDTLIGTPLFAGGYGDFTTVNGLDSITNDTSTFDPGIAGAGTKNIKYTYTNIASNCKTDTTIQVVVYSLPNVAISLPAIGNDLSSGNYCISIDNVNLTAQVNGISATMGDFWGNGVADTLANDGLASFQPNTFTISDTLTPFLSDTVYFGYTDTNTTCYNSTFQAVKVYTLPWPYITGISDTSFYCNNSTGFSVFGKNHADAAIKSTSWLVNGLPSGQSINPNNLPAGAIPIELTLTDINGCIDKAYDTLDVHPLPIAEWWVTNECIAQPIQFNDSSYIADVGLNDSIVSWSWDFGVFGADTTIQNPTYQYESTSPVQVTLIVETNYGCVESNTDNLFNLGDLPPTSFSWVNECDGEEVKFIVSEETADPDNEIDQYQWDFGDGNDTIMITADTVFNSYAIGATQPYNVQLIVSNSSGCIDSSTQVIHIRPFYTPTHNSPYFVDFETDEDGWIAASLIDTVNTWAFGTPNKSAINSAHSGVNTWVTSLDTNYLDNEQSWVTSPCFDLSGLQRPMIKVWINTDLKANDGAVLQSTVNAGQTWENIGKVNSGLNWFNLNGLEGNPGEQSLSDGYVGWNDSTGAWVEARHSLDELYGRENVRFRIAFGSNLTQNTNDEGIAFDDIWIGDRERIVLVEQFTNMGMNTAGKDYDDDVIAIVDANPKDVVDIHYHTSFPAKDEFNTNNPSDPSSRVLFYGITETPYTHMDGNQYSGASLTEQELDHRVLQDPQFDIDLSTDIVGTQINIEAQITSRESRDSSDITLQIAIVESSIDYSGKTYSSVLTKLLPDAAGYNYEKAWNVGEAKYVATSYDLTNLYDPNLFEVIAFVQNNTTREVYQVAFNDTAQLSSTVIVEQIVDELDYDFALFPNPTKGQAMLLLGDMISGNVTVNVINQVGQLVSSEKVGYGINRVEVDLNNQLSGVYYVQVMDNSTSAVLGTKKLVLNR